MKRRVARRLLGAGLLAASGAAWACADTSCEVTWSLFSASGPGCQNSIVMSPGNDTRVNLMLLLRDRAGLAVAGKSYPALDWDTQGFGRNFIDWDLLQAGLFPQTAAEQEDAGGSYPNSYCQTLESGAANFAAATAAARSLPAGERTALIAARERLVQACAGGKPAGYVAAGEKPEVAPPVLPEWPGGIASASGKAFLGYLQAADAFYGERWDEARQGFAALRSSAEPWVAETAAYMAARVELNAAQVSAFDEYGSYEGLKKLDQASVTRGRAALAAYLKAWPQGRYAASARGLVRRGEWLAGDYKALSGTYEGLLGTTRADDAASAELVQEVDNKLLFNSDAENFTAQGALLLATIDLMRMREDYEAGPDIGNGETGPGKVVPAKFPAETLAAQAPFFAGQPELFSFLQANHAFYVAKDYRRVLQLIADDAQKPSYSPLAFSRQVLRGMALSALGDRNEAGFWQQLSRGANGLWQRPTVELALAMNFERHGRLGPAFAADSPITDSAIRMILLENNAGVDLLRQAAKDGSRPLVERNMALATLFYKQLSRGDYAGFVASRAIIVPAAKLAEGDAYAEWNRSEVAKSFVSGRWGGDYACPTLLQTAQTLARDPQSVPAKLCLGEFWRLNGFDGDLGNDAHRHDKDELGGGPSLFAGQATPRAAIYASVIGNAKAAPADKAYALYRAVMCYAPSGYNSCGGEGVELPQRKAWFNQLRRDFPASPWAKKLRYYW